MKSIIFSLNKKQKNSCLNAKKLLFKMMLIKLLNYLILSDLEIYLILFYLYINILEISLKKNLVYTFMVKLNLLNFYHLVLV